MNKKIIETNAVCEIYRIMNKTRVIDTYIEFNDKTPIWDGEFHLHKKATENFLKENLIGKIPTQVKGKCVTRFSREVTNFRFERVNLEKYLIDGGIFFIMGEMKEEIGEQLDKVQLYYKSLLPIDIKKILDSKKGRKTFQLEMKKLPIKSEEIIELFRIFLENRKLQGESVLNVKMSIEDMQDIMTVPKTVNARMDIGDEYYIYSNQTGIPIPVDTITISTIKAINFIDIEIDGKKEKVKAEIIKNANNQYQVKIFEYITFIINEEKGVLNFNMFPKDAKNTVKSIEFLKNIELGKQVLFNSKKIQGKEKLDMEGYNKDYIYLKAIVELAEYFGIEDEIDCTKVSVQYLEMAVKIRNALFNGNYETNTNLKDEEILNIIKYPIGNSIILIAGYFHNNKLKVYDVFKKEFGEVIKVFTDTSEMKEEISYYLVLDEEQIQAINFNKENVLESIKKMKITEDSIERINLFILILIKGYDEVKREIFLETATELLEYIESDYPDKEILFINKMQINKRLEKVVDYEKLLELELKMKSEELEKKIAINILLDNKRVVEYLYNKLNLESKEIFKEYPIYTLMSK